MRTSALAMGTMTFGGEADEDAAKQIFQRCLDAGINHFDTADVYQGGRSEEILGRLMQGNRDALVVASKVYFPTGNKGENDRGLSRKHIVRSVEGSLRRLGTDRLDLLYLHRWDEATALEETVRALEVLVAQGKVLYPALSNFSAWQSALTLCEQRRWNFAPIVALQPMYNLLKRQAEVELLPFALHHKLAVFSYSPLAGGVLSGKYQNATDGQARGRLDVSEVYRMRYQDGLAVGGAFSEVAKRYSIAAPTLALAWVLHQKGVTAPLVGARNLQQLEPLLAAVDVRLSDEQLRELEGLVPTPAPATDRSEEGKTDGLGAR